jgi:hypothetical protein
LSEITHFINHPKIVEKIVSIDDIGPPADLLEEQALGE